MIVNEGGGGKRLPTLTDPATEYDIARGKQAIDANGEILTGQIQTFESGYSSGLEATQVYAGSSGPLEGPMVDKIYMKYKVPDYPSYSMLYRPGSTIGIDANRSLFGNATPADVLIGKTFTSASGLNVQGTGTFMKVGIAEITNSYGATNTLMVSNYPGTSIPNMVFIWMSSGVPIYSNEIYQLSMVNAMYYISANNSLARGDVEYGVMTPTNPANGSLYVDTTYKELRISSPNNKLGSGYPFGMGYTYQVLYLYN